MSNDTFIELSKNMQSIHLELGWMLLRWMLVVALIDSDGGKA